MSRTAPTLLSDSTATSNDAPLPITRGNLSDFPADPIACLRRLAATHGEIAAMEQDDVRIHFVFGPQYNHRVLTDPELYQSRFFAVRGPKHSAQRRLTSGLLSANGEDHKRQRRMVMEAFLKKAIAGYVPVIQHHVNDLLATWKVGQERDISREMTDFMLRLTSLLLFGMSNVDLAFRIGEMIDEWVRLNHELGIGALVSDPTCAERYDELLNLAAGLERDISAMILDCRSDKTGGANVLSLMIDAHDEEGRLSDAELLGQAALIFGAAHLTTAHTLTWTLFLLAQHPSVLSAIDAELFATPANPAAIFDESALPALDRAIKESMRVLPASAYSQRITSAPTELGPFSLPRGGGVVFSQFITHHLPSLFPDPEAFLPDRWKTITPSPYAYLPFGAGPRRCLGGPLAMTILKMTLPEILRRFRLEVAPDSEVSGRVVSTMLSPTGPVRMRLLPPRSFTRAQPVLGNIHDLVELRELPRVVRRAA